MKHASEVRAKQQKKNTHKKSMYIFNIKMRHEHNTKFGG